MAKATPRSVRFDPDVDARLSSYVASHSGSSSSSVANRFVDEALRMEEHPGVVFRDGPGGRRAVLIGGPDVWEVIRSVRSARESEPELSAGEIVALVVENSGLAHRLVETAVRYWAAYPDEIDRQVQLADMAERTHHAEWLREQELLER
jgi:hypothetical protein